MMRSIINAMITLLLTCYLMAASAPPVVVPKASTDMGPVTPTVYCKTVQIDYTSTQSAAAGAACTTIGPNFVPIGITSSPVAGAIGYAEVGDQNYGYVFDWENVNLQHSTQWVCTPFNCPWSTNPIVNQPYTYSESPGVTTLLCAARNIVFTPGPCTQ